MRHRKGFNHLGRTSSHRKAMLANMASSLILHKRIKTTTAKAKALRMYVEPLITKSKDDSTHSRRVVFSYLQDKYAVNELFREVSLKIADRPGGYTRILKTGNRLGDNADMCIIELVDYNENMLQAKETAKAKPTRRRRGKKKTDTPLAETGEQKAKVESVETDEKSVDEGESTKSEETPIVEEKPVIDTKKAEANDERPEIVEEKHEAQANKEESVEAKKEEPSEEAEKKEEKKETNTEKKEDKSDNK